MSRSLRELYTELGYQFSDRDLITTALTHRSAGSRNNERLEFLGDSILNFVIANALYRRFPKANEGELSRIRANLVNGETLAEIAKIIELGDYLKLGAGELKSGGFRRESILAGSLEAVFGAVYLDGGVDACYKLINDIYQDKLSSVSLNAELKDPKTRLQEYLQSMKRPLPNYVVKSIEGSDHKQLFIVECRFDDLAETVMGEGASRRRAEQDAAAKALEILISG